MLVFSLSLSLILFLYRCALDNRTALHEAVLSCNTAAVRELYEYGANPTLCDVNQRTPLHYAAMSDHELREIISILVQREFSFADKWGLTPLHYLIYKKHNSLTNLFTSSKHGCNMCIVYDIRRSVLNTKKDHNHPGDDEIMPEVNEVPTPIAVPSTAWTYTYEPQAPEAAPAPAAAAAAASSKKSDPEDPDEGQELDRYGFLIKDGEEDKFKLSASQQALEEKLSIEWAQYLKDWDRAVQKSNGKELKQKCELGIPDSVRGEVWKKFLGVRDLAARQPYTYDLLSTATAKPEAALQIDLDIKRSHMDHAFFTVHYSSGQVKMFNVMRAYSLYDPVVGYTQGMSDIAGFFLMYMQEEEAFWAFTQLMFDPAWHMQQFFTDGFPQLELFSYIQNKFLEKFFPEIVKHMNKVEFDPYTIQPHAMEWYMDLFIRILPFEYVIRIMDVLMARGINAIFKFAMAIFKILHDQLMKTDSFPYLMRDLKNPYPLFPRKNPSDKDSIVTPDEFVKIAMKFKITSKQVSELVAEFPEFKRSRMNGMVKRKK